MISGAKTSFITARFDWELQRWLSFALISDTLLILGPVSVLLRFGGCEGMIVLSLDEGSYCGVSWSPFCFNNLIGSLTYKGHSTRALPFPLCPLTSFCDRSYCCRLMNFICPMCVC